MIDLFVYVDDVADGFVKAIEKAIPRGVYNLGSGASTSVLELCRKAERVVLGSSGITEVLERREDLPPQDVNFWANIQRSREILGWEPQTSLESGIVQTWEWMQLQ